VKVVKGIWSPAADVEMNNNHKLSDPMSSRIHPRCAQPGQTDETVEGGDEGDVCVEETDEEDRVGEGEDEEAQVRFVSPYCGGMSEETNNGAYCCSFCQKKFVTPHGLEVKTQFFFII